MMVPEASAWARAEPMGPGHMGPKISGPIYWRVMLGMKI